MVSFIFTLVSFILFYIIRQQSRQFDRRVQFATVTAQSMGNELYSRLTNVFITGFGRLLHILTTNPSRLPV